MEKKPLNNVCMWYIQYIQSLNHKAEVKIAYSLLEKEKSNDCKKQNLYHSVLDLSRFFKNNPQIYFKINTFWKT